MTSSVGSVATTKDIPGWIDIVKRSVAWSASHPKTDQTDGRDFCIIDAPPSSSDSKDKSAVDHQIIQFLHKDGKTVDMSGQVILLGRAAPVAKRHDIFEWTWGKSYPGWGTGYDAVSKFCATCKPPDWLAKRLGERRFLATQKFVDGLGMFLCQFMNLVTIMDTGMGPTHGESFWIGLNTLESVHQPSTLSVAQHQTVVQTLTDKPTTANLLQGVEIVPIAQLKNGL